MTISKILIANRGEIACRIIETAHAMGIKTAAVYSDADGQHGLPRHCQLADERVPIGPRDNDMGVEPYLIAERIVDAAKAVGADAIHPGYGFLSENPGFVEAVESAGLIFIGPSASAIRAMGLKDNAKALMEKAGVPVVPGYHGEAQDLIILASKAKEIGYPVLIKARAGGGGKGMRLVEKHEDFEASLRSAKREAASSFGDDRVLVEKFITNPRHIEVQVFGDSQGNVVHLFERDCSLQRRHQKVIEEAPAPGMTDEMRNAMTSAAVKAAQAINYESAGTIEFIVDGSGPLRIDGFWFMEMNTRLQVEHPVTEEITGQDLVEWQIRVAQGEQLPCKQDEIEIEGHAFEARIYAEDVPKGFLPATGKLHVLEFSQNARNETGVEQGDVISPFYDPMIAKVVTHSQSRQSALGDLYEALADTRIAGTVTNIAFLKMLCKHIGFANGNVDTGLIERDLDQLTIQPQPNDKILVLAASQAMNLPCHGSVAGNEDDPFDFLTGFALWESQRQVQCVEFDGETYEIAFQSRDNQWHSIITKVGEPRGALTPVPLDDEIWAKGFQGGVAVFSPEGTFEFTVHNPLDVSATSAANPNAVIAPMPGLVKQVSISTGESVKEGQVLIVLEAMKMEHSLTAPRDGVVEELNTSIGDQVEDGAALLTLEEA